MDQPNPEVPIVTAPDLPQSIPCLYIVGDFACSLSFGHEEDHSPTIPVQPQGVADQ